jgi:putative transposase
MPCLSRSNFPGIPQCLIRRGNDRQVCFLRDQDYKVYLDKLKEYSRKCGVDMHAYVLMTSHVHLLLTLGDL